MPSARLTVRFFHTVTKEFATDFIDALKTQLDLQVSVVEYGNQGIPASGLTTPDAAITVVNDLVYSGGFTNLEQAIAECQKTLEGSPAPVMVVVGDGVANKFGNPATGDAASARPAAANAATAAKDAGIQIATAHFDDVYLTPEGAEFFEQEIASPGLAFGPLLDPVLFPELAQELADALFERVECSSN